MLKNVQRLALHQKLSPQAIQAQLLLTVPALELEEEVKNQLEQNPLLEEYSNDEEQPQAANAESPPEIEKLIGEMQPGGTTNGYDYSRKSETNDYLLNSYSKTYDSPLEQMYSLGLDEKDELIAVEIIGSLDDDGYLRTPVEDLVKDLNTRYNLEVDKNDIEVVLKVINKLEPVGIGARDIKECLTIQLHELEIDETLRELCIKMINNYFDEFSHKHFEKLMKELDVTKETLSGMFEVIHKLSPHPGAGSIGNEADYIYPDFIVTKAGDKWEVELTKDSSVNVRISPKYLELYTAKGTPEETKEFIKHRLESAQWFLNSLKSRKETMLKVMRAIVNRQIEFFETNGDVLKPMFEKDIAEDISMDISTVSRVIRGKYAQTDFGIFELKYFFGNAYKTESGGDISNKIIKEKIKSIIDSEDKAKPLSDDSVAEQMKKEGFNIARRTVAKYREAMQIPKATLRRKIVL